MNSDSADIGSTDLTFPNILAVVEYLKAGGWKIAKSMAYQHRKEGKVRPREDGVFHVKDVVKYARVFLRKIETGKTVSADIDAVQQEKARAETDKLKAQAEHWQIKTAIARGLLVEKDQFERELARRAAVFRADIENFIRAHAAGITALVSGDATKAPDLIEYMMDAAEGWLDRYSGEHEFSVPLPVVSAADDDGEEDADEGEDDDDVLEIQEEGVAEI